MEIVGAICTVGGWCLTCAIGESQMSSRLGSWPTRAQAVIVSVLALALGLALSAVDGSVRPAPAAAGVSAVGSRGTAGVTADALPTVQVNGIVWTQVVVGNTVYAGGQFSTARPAGAAPGKSTVRRSNLLAFDIRTGKLIASFAPSVNGAVRALAVSPDKKTLYVGGAFTSVNGKKRLRFAAVATSGGALRALAPAFNNQVRAILATSSTVYVGGTFSKVGTSARSRLAAIRATDAKLRSWKPSANGDVVAFTPDPRSPVDRGRRVLLQDRQDRRVRHDATRSRHRLRALLVDQHSRQELRQGHRHHESEG